MGFTESCRRPSKGVLLHRQNNLAWNGSCSTSTNKGNVGTRESSRHSIYCPLTPGHVTEQPESTHHMILIPPFTYRLTSTAAIMTQCKRSRIQWLPTLPAAVPNIPYRTARPTMPAPQVVLGFVSNTLPSSVAYQVETRRRMAGMQRPV